MSTSIVMSSRRRRKRRVFNAATHCSCGRSVDDSRANLSIRLTSVPWQGARAVFVTYASAVSLPIPHQAIHRRHPRLRFHLRIMFQLVAEALQ